MESVIFKTDLKQLGTTPAKHRAQIERHNRTPTPFTRLCDYFVALPDPRIEFLYLATQRRTNTTLAEFALYLGRSDVDVADDMIAAGKRLAEQRSFARRFNQFLTGFDFYLEELKSQGEEEAVASREQADDYGDNFEMTYEEIGARMGLSWQRVQQLEQSGLAKLRANPEALAALRGASIGRQSER